ncbi:UNVERIFIED_CONTAM: hypothetical protein HDU68_003640 [Siphonaria sp. JEL0065]|nr:hypothetical protein HDU68_003640 [Siphonaria sp. JEL0065]
MPEVQVLRLVQLKSAYVSGPDKRPFSILIGEIKQTWQGFEFGDRSTQQSAPVRLLAPARTTVRRVTQWVWTGLQLIVGGLTVVRASKRDELEQQPTFSLRFDFDLEGFVAGECAFLSRLWRQTSLAMLHALRPSLSFAFSGAANSLSFDSELGHLKDLRKAKRVSLFGAVLAKSALLEINNCLFFIVAINCGDSIVNPGCNHTERIRLVTAHILFEQRPSASAPFDKQISTAYEDVLVNSLYLFINLDTKQIKFTSKLPDSEDPKSNIKKVLSFSFTDSIVYPLDETAANLFISQKHTSLQKSPLPAPITLHNPESATRIITYTGVITNILDLDVGKYQLDNKHELFLTYHPLPIATEMLLISGTRVTFHNIHIILFEHTNLPANLPNKAILVACLNTCLEILEYPPQLDFDNTIHEINADTLTRRNQMKSKWKGMNMMDLVILDDLYVLIQSLKDTNSSRNGVAGGWSSDSAVSFSLAKQVLRECSGGFQEWPKGAGDARLASVLAHEKECSVAELRYIRPFMVSIDLICGEGGYGDGVVGTIAEYIESTRVKLCGDTFGAGYQDQYARGAGGIDFGFKVFRQKELGIENCFLLGNVVWMNGGLYFLDSSGSKPMLIVFLRSVANVEAVDQVEPIFRSLEYLGTCLVIREFEIVVEVLGVHHTNEESLPIVKKYIRCLPKDCFFKASWIPKNGSGGDILEHLEETVRDLETILIRVENMATPTMSLSVGEQFVDVKARLYGNIWRISVESGEAQVIECFENAICEVHRESLHLWPLFEHSVFYLISNIQLRVFEDDGPKKSASVYCKATESSMVNAINLEIAPSIQQAGLFDFSYSPPILYMDPPTTPKPPNVYKLLQSLSKVSIPYKAFHHALVSVEGTIISKSFSSTAPFHLHERLPAIQLLQNNNIGLGRYDRIMVLKIADRQQQGTFQQYNSPDATLQIYLDVRTQCFQPGLIPGSRVRIHALGIKMASSSRAFYGQSVSETSIEVLETNESTTSLMNGDGLGGSSITEYFRNAMHTVLPRLFLVNVYSIPGGLKMSPFTISCVITHVEEVCLWCECAVCGVKYSNEGGQQCACRSADAGKAPVRVQGKAKLYVEDGTGEAMVLVDSLEGLVGLFGEGASNKKLEDVVMGAGIDVEYYKNPPWITDETMMRTDTVCDATVGVQEAGGFEYAKSLLHKLVAKVSLTSDFVVCCRQLTSLWYHGNDEEEEDAEEYDLRDVDLTNLYTQIRAKDLIKKQVRLAEGAMIQVFVPPRIVLHGYYLEVANPLIEGMRLIQ